MRKKQDTTIENQEEQKVSLKVILVSDSYIVLSDNSFKKIENAKKKYKIGDFFENVKENIK